MKRVKDILLQIFLVGSGSLLGGSAAYSQGLPEICDVIVSVCEITNYDSASNLASNVCYDGRSVALPDPAGGCVAGDAFYATYGYQPSPRENTLVVQKPVPYTCDVIACDYQTGSWGDGIACCDPGTNECEAPDENDSCGFGEITWCKEIENNADGTVTCHE